MARRVRRRKPNTKPTNFNYRGRHNLLPASAVKATDKIVINFGQTPRINGLPDVTISPNTVGRTLDAVTLSGQNLVLDFSGAVASATTISFADLDPAIRSLSGGFVSARQFPVT